MVSSGMLRRVDLVRTDVSEKPCASFIRVKRIGELGTTLAATSNRVRRLLVAASVVPSSQILVTDRLNAFGIRSETDAIMDLQRVRRVKVSFADLGQTIADSTKLESFKETCT
jgi:hypothetical protein